MTLGSISLDNIKVGYITDDGYVSGVSIADAMSANPSSYLDNIPEVSFDPTKNIKPPFTV